MPTSQEHWTIVDLSANGPTRGMLSPPRDAHGNIITPRQPTAETPQAIAIQKRADQWPPEVHEECIKLFKAGLTERECDERLKIGRFAVTSILARARRAGRDMTRARRCDECNADISHRAPRAKHCEHCASLRQDWVSRLVRKSPRGVFFHASVTLDASSTTAKMGKRRT